MKTKEEKKEYDRIRWAAIDVDKRENCRLRNIKWRKNNPGAGARATANYRKNHPDRIKNLKLTKCYGISFQDYQRMHEQQKGLCAICNLPEKAKHNGSKKVQRLAVDHCHKTGKVRALLCQDCNRGIGKFFDDITRLQSAINYLTFHSTETTV